MKGKKLKLLTEIIAIVVVCLISFVGVYKINSTKTENQVKEYTLAKEFEGYREFVFELDNVEDENANEENYKKSKKIIEERLKELGVEDYNVSLNYENGAIYVQMPENSETDHVAGNILQVANFKVTDSEDENKVLLTNSDLQKVSAIYNTSSSGTTVYLQIKFNKNGKKVLKELSTGEYATKPEEETESSNDTNEVAANATVSNDETTITTETEESEETAESNSQKKIKLSIDDNNMITTSFDDPIEDGTLYLAMGQASTDSTKIADSIRSTSTIAIVLNSGKMPLTYKISEDRFINETNADILKNIIYVMVGVSIIAILFLVFKYKLRGIIAGVSYIGFVAVYLLAIRYFNVVVSYESLVALGVILGINFCIIKNILSIEEKDKEVRSLAYKNSIKSTILALLPLFIISVISAFIKLESVATFGMSMFWGITLSIIYNYIITKDMLN